MPQYDVTLAQVRTQVARMIGDLVATGTLAAANASQAYSFALVHQTSDQLKGKWLYIKGGGTLSTQQQENPIFAFTPYTPGVASGGRVDFLQPWGVVPTIGNAYDIYNLVRPSLYTEAIQRQVRLLARKQLVPSSTTTFTLTGGTLAYNLPATMAWLEDLAYETVNGERMGIIPKDDYRIEASGPTESSVPQVVFHKLADTYTGYIARVIGQVVGVEPALEADLISVDPDLVAFRTAEEMLLHLPWGESDRKAWQAKYAALGKRADETERRFNSRPNPGSLRVKDV